MVNKAILINFCNSIFLIALRFHSLFTDEAFHRMIVKKYYLYLISPLMLTFIILSLLYVFGHLIFSSLKNLSVSQVIMLMPSLIVLLGLIFGW